MHPAGAQSFQGDPAYVASKGGLEALVRALAVELGEKGIVANAIAPGFFLTDVNATFFAQPRFVELARRIPLRRFGRPDKLVGAAIFLASDAASYITTSPDGGRGALGRPVAGPPRPTPDWDGTHARADLRHAT